MDKKMFERFEVRSKKNDASCLPLVLGNFRIEPKEYPPDAFLKIESRTKPSFYHNDRILLPLTDGGQIVAFFGQPYIGHTCQKAQKTMYGIDIVYLKTQENQEIFDCDQCKIMETLNKNQGILETLDIFFLPYDDFIRVAIEHKHRAVGKNNLKQIVLKIIETFFLADNLKIQDFQCIQSYTEGEFKKIFDNSNRNKKIVFYSDVVDENGMEILNSIKHEVSLKHYTKIDGRLKQLVKMKFSSYKAVRYVLKCEDLESKTASFEGDLEDFDDSQEWTHPARILIQNNTIDLFSFLRMNN